MYIHIGEDVLVHAKDIIAILDKESASSSKLTEEFLGRQGNLMVNITKKPYKSVVVTTKNIYFSPLAAGTLGKRSHDISIHES